MPQPVNYLIGVARSRHLAFISVFRVGEGVLALPQEVYRCIGGSGTAIEMMLDALELEGGDIPPQSHEPLASIEEIGPVLQKALVGATFSQQEVRFISENLEDRLVEELTTLMERENLESAHEADPR